MGTFEAIGQSGGLGEVIKQLRINKQNEIVGKQNDDMLDLRRKELGMQSERYGILNQASELDINLKKQQLSEYREQQAKLDESHLFDMHMEGVYGGPKGKPAQLMRSIATSRGWIDPETGTIKNRYAQEGLKLIQEPQYAVNLNLAAAQEANEKVGRLTEAANNPELLKQLGLSKKDLPGALKQAKIEQDTVAGNHARLIQELNAKAAEANARAAEQRASNEAAGKGFTLAEGATRFDSSGNPVAVNPKTTGPTTKTERETEARKEALPKIEKMDPNEAYRQGWKLNEDGSVFVEADTGAPVKLPSFDKKMGKRGQITAVLSAGEQWNDAVQINRLLSDKEVSTALNEAVDAGLWDNALGRWKNSVRGWLQKKGYATDSKTTEAIVRMSRFASSERKTFLGTAASVAELKSVQAWLPNPGDSFDTMINKMRVAEDEGKEVFTRFLDVYKDEANMTPFYKAFGLSRFDKESNQKSLDVASDADALIRKYTSGN